MAQVKTPSRLSLPCPECSRHITIANQRGGVGKTTSTVNIASALTWHGLKALVIDSDPQGNVSTVLGIEYASGIPSAYESPISELQIDDVIQRSPESENLLCMPMALDLTGSEIELASPLDRERQFLDVVPDQYLIDSGFDFLIIDYPPSFSLLALNSMTAANEISIPIQCEFCALEDATQLMNNVQMIRQHPSPELHTSAMLLTMFDGRTKLSEEAANKIRSYSGNVVLRNLTPRSMRVSEAPGYLQTVIPCDPGSRGAVAYLDAAKELTMRGGYSAVPGGSAIE